MSQLVTDLREKLKSKKYSRSEGLRAVVAMSKKLSGELGPPLIKYDWLSRFVSEKIKNPGFDRIERLQAVLAKLDEIEEAK